VREHRLFLAFLSYPTNILPSRKLVNMKFYVLVLGAAALGAAPVSVRESGFAPGQGGSPPGWRTWSPRADIAPKTFVDQARSRGEAGALAISGNGNAAASGGWERTMGAVEPGKWYRLGVSYTASGLKFEANEVVCRIEWLDAAGKRAGQPEYAYKLHRDGEWRNVEATVPAPPKAAAAKLQLWLHNSPGGTVWFDDVSFDSVAEPAPRKVVIAAIHHRPRNTKGPADSVQRFIDVVEKNAPAKTDVVLLPEGITVVGTGKSYYDVAEPVPGPTTKTLGELARKRNTYIAAGIYEREGAFLYNTSVLLDRKGKLVGKYRKVYLPREEIESGITPGNDYPVFDTDFGKVGMMICWDVQYADPARALALRGAELILLPIWGGNMTLTRARAIENSVFVALSGYDIETSIIDRKGETVATAPGPDTAVVATVDLNRRYEWEWLGDMRGRFMKEVRLDVPMRRPDYEK
jgi:predicted amidohydrolase